jgi:hypothetical protein
LWEAPVRLFGEEALPLRGAPVRLSWEEALGTKSTLIPMEAVRVDEEHKRIEVSVEIDRVKEGPGLRRRLGDNSAV